MLNRRGLLLSGAAAPRALSAWANIWDDNVAALLHNLVGASEGVSDGAGIVAGLLDRDG